MKDLDRISESLLVALKISYKVESGGINDPMFRWLDFRLRHIDPRPRRVHISKKLLAATVPPKYRKVISRVVRKIQSGEDINPMQGKGLTVYQGTGLRNRTKRTDLLWADWGIHHLHLSTESARKNQYYLPRSDWLLFAIFLNEDALLVDVGHHQQPNAFENTCLVKILIREFPEYAERFRMLGVLPGAEVSEDEVRAARRGGVMTPVVVDGVAYMPPGLGVNTASTSNRVSMEMVNVSVYVNYLAQLVADKNGQIQITLREKGVLNPRLSLALTPNGLGVYEETLDTSWMWSKPYVSNQETPIERLRDLFTPGWLALLIQREMANKGTTVLTGSS